MFVSYFSGWNAVNNLESLHRSSHKFTTRNKTSEQQWLQRTSSWLSRRCHWGDCHLPRSGGHTGGSSRRRCTGPCWEQVPACWGSCYDRRPRRCHRHRRSSTALSARRWSNSLRSCPNWMALVATAAGRFLSVWIFPNGKIYQNWEKEYDVLMTGVQRLNCKREKL